MDVCITIFYLAYFIRFKICWFLSLEAFQLNIIIFTRLVLNILRHFNIRPIDTLNNVIIGKNESL